MAMRHGKNGVVTWTGETQANVKSWNFDYVCSIAESTTMDSADDYKEHLVGFTDWKAIVEINVDATNVLLGTSVILGELGDSGTIVFGDGTDTFTGTGIAVNCAISVNKNNTVSAVYSFEGSSKIT